MRRPQRALANSKTCLGEIVESERGGIIEVVSLDVDA